VLQIGENSIDDTELTDFLELPISSMPHLKLLDLSRNPITGKSIVQLFTSIAKAEPHLESLNLTGCQLKDEGLAELLHQVIESDNIL